MRFSCYCLPPHLAPPPSLPVVLRYYEAKILASKFYCLYNLLKELLSKQNHYEWGLRAVKAVLYVAGIFRREDPDMGEQELLMRALRDSNTPKIVAEDEVVFHGLLGDLFPGLSPPRKVSFGVSAWLGLCGGRSPAVVVRRRALTPPPLLSPRSSRPARRPSSRPMPTTSCTPIRS